MTTLENIPMAVANQIEELKMQQEKCTRFLVDCITVRDQYPQFADRIDTVLDSVETVMSQNAQTLARLEADASIVYWFK